MGRRWIGGEPSRSAADGSLVRREAPGAVAPRTVVLSAAAPRTIEPRLAGPRPMVRATQGIIADTRPVLRLVPRRHRATRWAVVLCAIVVIAMAGAAAFQTQLAQRQVQLDRIERDIQSSRQQYEQLRRERAELRSPARLSEIATSLGMVPASEDGFIVIAADVVATIRESAGTIGVGAGGSSGDQLAQFREVKSVTEIAP